MKLLTVLVFFAVSAFANQDNSEQNDNVYIKIALIIGFIGCLSVSIIIASSDGRFKVKRKKRSRSRAVITSNDQSRDPDPPNSSVRPTEIENKNFFTALLSPQLYNNVASGLKVAICKTKAIGEGAFAKVFKIQLSKGTNSAFDMSKKEELPDFLKTITARDIPGFQNSFKMCENINSSQLQQTQFLALKRFSKKGEKENYWNFQKEVEACLRFGLFDHETHMAEFALALPLKIYVAGKLQFDTEKSSIDFYSILSEFYDGTLTWFLLNLKQKELSVEETKFTIAASLSAVLVQLFKLHQFNVVHGDVKPENILVQINPLRTSIADFGIATKAIWDKKQSGSVCGTHDFNTLDRNYGFYTFRDDFWGILIGFFMTYGEKDDPLTVLRNRRNQESKSVSNQDWISEKLKINFLLPDEGMRNDQGILHAFWIKLQSHFGINEFDTQIIQHLKSFAYEIFKLPKSSTLSRDNLKKILDQFLRLKPASVEDNDERLNLLQASILFLRDNTSFSPAKRYFNASNVLSSEQCPALTQKPLIVAKWKETLTSNNEFILELKNLTSLTRNEQIAHTVEPRDLVNTKLFFNEFTCPPSIKIAFQFLELCFPNEKYLLSIENLLAFENSVYLQDTSRQANLQISSKFSNFKIFNLLRADFQRQTALDILKNRTIKVKVLLPQFSEIFKKICLFTANNNVHETLLLNIGFVDLEFTATQAYFLFALHIYHFVGIELGKMKSLLSLSLKYKGSHNNEFQAMKILMTKPIWENMCKFRQAIIVSLSPLSVLQNIYMDVLPATFENTLSFYSPISLISYLEHGSFVSGKLLQDAINHIQNLTADFCECVYVGPEIWEELETQCRRGSFLDLKILMEGHKTIVGSIIIGPNRNHFGTFILHNPSENGFFFFGESLNDPSQYIFPRWFLEAMTTNKIRGYIPMNKAVNANGVINESDQLIFINQHDTNYCGASAFFSGIFLFVWGLQADKLRSKRPMRNMCFGSICPKNEEHMRGALLQYVLDKNDEQSNCYISTECCAVPKTIPRIFFNDPDLPETYHNTAYRSDSTLDVIAEVRTYLQSKPEPEMSLKSFIFEHLKHEHITHSLIDRHYVAVHSLGYNNVPSLDCFRRKKMAGSTLIDFLAQSYLPNSVSPQWIFLSDHSICKLSSNIEKAKLKIPEFRRPKSQQYVGLLACVHYSGHYVALCIHQKFKKIIIHDSLLSSAESLQDASHPLKVLLSNIIANLYSQFSEFMPNINVQTEQLSSIDIWITHWFQQKSGSNLCCFLSLAVLELLSNLDDAQSLSLFSSENFQQACNVFQQSVALTEQHETEIRIYWLLRSFFRYKNFNSVTNMSTLWKKSLNEQSQVFSLPTEQKTFAITVYYHAYNLNDDALKKNKQSPLSCDNSKSEAQQNFLSQKLLFIDQQNEKSLNIFLKDAFTSKLLSDVFTANDRKMISSPSFQTCKRTSEISKQEFMTQANLSPLKTPEKKQHDHTHESHRRDHHSSRTNGEKSQESDLENDDLYETHGTSSENYLPDIDEETVSPSQFNDSSVKNVGSLSPQQFREKNITASDAISGTLNLETLKTYDESIRMKVDIDSVTTVHENLAIHDLPLNEDLTIEIFLPTNLQPCDFEIREPKFFQQKKSTRKSIKYQKVKIGAILRDGYQIHIVMCRFDKEMESNSENVGQRNLMHDLKHTMIFIEENVTHPFFDIRYATQNGHRQNRYRNLRTFFTDIANHCEDFDEDGFVALCMINVKNKTQSYDYIKRSNLFDSFKAVQMKTLSGLYSDAFLKTLEQTASENRFHKSDIFMNIDFGANQEPINNSTLEDDSSGVQRCCLLFSGLALNKINETLLKNAKQKGIAVQKFGSHCLLPNSTGTCYAKGVKDQFFYEGTFFNGLKCYIPDQNLILSHKIFKKPLELPLHLISCLLLPNEALLKGIKTDLDNMNSIFEEIFKGLDGSKGEARIEIGAESYILASSLFSEILFNIQDSTPLFVSINKNNIQSYMKECLRQVQDMINISVTQLTKSLASNLQQESVDETVLSVNATGNNYLNAASNTDTRFQNLIRQNFDVNDLNDIVAVRTNILLFQHCLSTGSFSNDGIIKTIYKKAISDGCDYFFMPSKDDILRAVTEYCALHGLADEVAFKSRFAASSFNYHMNAVPKALRREEMRNKARISIKFFLQSLYTNKNWRDALKFILKYMQTELWWHLQNQGCLDKFSSEDKRSLQNDALPFTKQNLQKYNPRKSSRNKKGPSWENENFTQGQKEDIIRSLFVKRTVADFYFPVLLFSFKVKFSSSQSSFHELLQMLVNIISDENMGEFSFPVPPHKETDVKKVFDKELTYNTFAIFLSVETNTARLRSNLSGWNIDEGPQKTSSILVRCQKLIEEYKENLSSEHLDEYQQLMDLKYQKNFFWNPELHTPPYYDFILSTVNVDLFAPLEKTPNSVKFAELYLLNDFITCIQTSKSSENCLLKGKSNGCGLSVQRITDLFKTNEKRNIQIDGYNAHLRNTRAGPSLTMIRKINTPKTNSKSVSFAVSSTCNSSKLHDAHIDDLQNDTGFGLNNDGTLDSSENTSSFGIRVGSQEISSPKRKDHDDSSMSPQDDFQSKRPRSSSPIQDDSKGISFQNAPQKAELLLFSPVANEAFVLTSSKDANNATTTDSSSRIFFFKPLNQGCLDFMSTPKRVPSSNQFKQLLSSHEDVTLSTLTADFTCQTNASDLISKHSAETTSTAKKHMGSERHSRQQMKLQTLRQKTLLAQTKLQVLQAKLKLKRINGHSSQHEAKNYLSNNIRNSEKLQNVGITTRQTSSNGYQGASVEHSQYHSRTSFNFDDLKKRMQKILAERISEFDASSEPTSEKELALRAQANLDDYIFSLQSNWSD